MSKVTIALGSFIIGLPQIDVEKSSSHQLSQTEMASDKPCSQPLFPNRLKVAPGLYLRAVIQ